MCLSTVYMEKNGERTRLADCVTGVDVTDGTVTITDLLGASTVIKGIIKSVDLVANTLILTEA